MSKITDAIGKVRRPDAAFKPAASRRAAANVSTQGRAPSGIQGIEFEALRKLGQFTPIDEDIAESNKIILSPNYEQAMASYKILRTRILHRMHSNGWNRLAVTSCGPGDGKTLTSINLAISLARQEDQNVVLIDLDLMRPSVCSRLGIVPTAGLAEYFSGDAALEDIVISPDIDRLTVLASTNRVANSSETLRSEKMLDLLETIAARGSSTIVVFDMPPLLRSDDVLAFGPLVDALLMVVSSGKSSRTDLKKAKEFLDEFNLIGTALNRSSESAPAYY